MAASGRGLPVALTSFIGRERERAEVRALLDSARLVTLTGVGGCGKTRLAAEVARQLGTETRWVDLQAVTEPTGVGEALLGATATRGTPGHSVVDVIAAQLGAEPVLVVLDSCEHVLDAVAQLVVGLLKVAPGVSILATSREPLGASGEVTWRVPSLDIPPERPDLAAADILATDGGRLFVERARAADTNFVLDDADAHTVARLLRRLDGLPLALELAATRVRAMSVSLLADALDDRFALLTEGDRSAEPRQRTLLASVDWSHDLLSAREQVLLRRLSVFATPFTARAAEAVASGDGLTMDEVLPLLVRLVDRSLVTVVPGPDLDRYRLLETIRAYATDRLDDAGERDAVCERHSAFFAARAAAVADGLDGPDHIAWLARVDLEYADLLAARRWALAHGKADTAARAAAHLARYWSSRGRIVAAERAFGEVLAADDLDAGTRAFALWGAAHVAHRAGDIDSASQRATAALPLAVEAGDDRTRARLLCILGSAVTTVDPRLAVPFLAEAAELAAQVDDTWCLIDALQLRGLALTLRFDEAEARRLLAESRSLALARGDETHLAWHDIGLGWLTSRSHLAEAERHLRAAIARGEVLRDPTTTSMAIAFLAEVLAWQGRTDEAIELLEPAERVGTAGDPSQSFGPLEGQRAHTLLLSGRAEDALAVFDRLAADPRLRDLPRLRAQADIGAGAALAALQRPEALTRLTAALAPNGVANRWLRCLGSVFRSTVRRRAGDRAGADVDARAALDLAIGSGFPILAVEALDCVAATRADTHPAEAARLVGATREQRRVRAMLAGVPGIAPSDDAEAVSRARVGETVWNRTVAEGAALAFDDAVTFGQSLLSGGVPSRPAKTGDGWDTLTRAEERVAQLAAGGLSNPRIAEMLHVSRETVKTHLSHVFAKLGVSNRAELAAAWTRREHE